MSRIARPICHGLRVHSQYYSRLGSAPRSTGLGPPCFYAYRREYQGGAPGCSWLDRTSVSTTRPDKEMDRSRQIEAVRSARRVPVDARPISRLPGCFEQQDAPIADALTDDGTRHRVSAISNAASIETITTRFEAMPDVGSPTAIIGSAAGGTRVSLAWSEPSSWSAFHRSMYRVRNGHEDVSVRSRARGVFFGMFLGGRWYRLELRGGPPAAQVGLKLRQRPAVGIDDPRTDPRIDFVGEIVTGRWRCEVGRSGSQWPCTSPETQPAVPVGHFMHRGMI